MSGNQKPLPYNAEEVFNPSGVPMRKKDMEL
jgi:hypothetical protein